MATRPLWVTDYHGNQLEAVDLGTPTKILKEILDIFGIDEGAEQTRVFDWWLQFKEYFAGQRTKTDLDEYNKLLTNAIGLLQRHIHATNYQQASRARWPCTMRTLLKIAAGIVGLLAKPTKRGLHTVQMMGHIGLHSAVEDCFVQDGWKTTAHSGLKLYLDTIETAVFLFPQSSYDEWHPWESVTHVLTAYTKSPIQVSTLQWCMPQGGPL